MAIDELRPAGWDDYFGQEELKARLRIHINAARNEYRMPEHVLLQAPAGYGKTSLAQIIANELDEQLEMVTMPITPTALLSIVRSFEGVLLMDEIHRATQKEVEILLPLLEFGYVQTAGGRRGEAGALTVIGATTERTLIEPLVDRFPIRPTFADYSHDQMTEILTSMCLKLDLTIDRELASELAVAAAGTPRRCRQFALAYRDLRASGYSDWPTVDQILGLCGVERDGLSLDHLRYMDTLAALGGAKGLKVLCSLLHMKEAAVMNLERDLLKTGLVQITTTRELTRKGFQRLKAERVAALN
jgi:holliday junction DNA helicase RuvB